MAATILERIVAGNRLELEAKKRDYPLKELQKLIAAQSPPLDFAAALRGESVRLIAEIKKASPSRGIIRDDFDPRAIAAIYTSGGAAAVSVLTEGKYFQGNLQYLRDVKKLLAPQNIPVLRKDFISDDYQVYESRAYGADCLLLIAAILTPEKLKSLLDLSHRLGMSCLVEIHDEAELEMSLASGAGIIGINNRDLNTFAVDLAATERLRPLIPAGRIVVSESGIKDRDDVARMQSLGVNAVLVGEALMSAPDIARRMRELLG